MKKQLQKVFLLVVLFIARTAFAQHPDSIHCDKGANKSTWVPKDWKHNDKWGLPELPNQGWSIWNPKDYQHWEEESAHTQMVPPDWKHNDKQGPEKTHLYPPDWKHNDIEGPDKSKTFPPDQKHNNIDGPDKSRVFPPTYKHDNTGGPNQSKMMYVGKKTSDVSDMQDSRNPANLDVYPNPANGSITISPVFFPSFIQQVEIKLYGLDGKMVFSEEVEKVSDNKVRLDLSALPVGVYVGKVFMNGSETNTFKVNKQ